MKTCRSSRAWWLSWVAWAALAGSTLALAVGPASAAARARAFAARGAPILPSLGTDPYGYLGAWPDPLHLCIMLLVMGTVTLSIGVFGLRMGRPPR